MVKIAQRKIAKMSARTRQRAWSMRLPPAQQWVRSWLQTPTSLTYRLHTTYGVVTVQRWQQGWVCVNTDEAICLGLPRRTRVWVRDVGLWAGGQLRVVAHTVVMGRQAQRMVARLGGRALGTVLFAQAQIQREPFTFAHLAWSHPLQRQLCQTLPAPRASRWWARRSVFAWQGGRILVTEVFLPAMCMAVPASIFGQGDE